MIPAFGPGGETHVIRGRTAYHRQMDRFRVPRKKRKETLRRMLAENRRLCRAVKKRANRSEKISEKKPKSL